MVTFTVTFTSDDDKAAPVVSQTDLQGAVPPGLEIMSCNSPAQYTELGASAPPNLETGSSPTADQLPPAEAPPPVPGMAAGLGAGSLTTDDDLGGAGPPPV